MIEVIALLVAVSALAAGGQATWNRVAQRAAFPVYRPRQTLGLRFDGVGLSRDTGCLMASWGSPGAKSGPHFLILEPGGTRRCGQPGIANPVASAIVNGVKVEVLAQCAAWPKCTVKDGETNGDLLLFVPERAGKHYTIQLQSGHVSLSAFLKVARSFTRVRTRGQALQKTWINTSGCASPGGGKYAGPVWAQHPAQIGITCDPHDVIVGARWRNWGKAQAQATATLAIDNCNPNCAAGRVRRYAITVLASKIRHCGARRVYGRVTYYRKVASRRRAYPVPAEGFC